MDDRFEKSQKDDGSPPRAAGAAPGRMTERLKSLIFASLVIVIALAPLPLGSNRPLPASLVGLAAGLIVAALALAAILGRSRAPFLPMRGLGLAALLFGFTIVWAFIQWLPLPFAGLAHPLWEEAAAALGRPLVHRISLDPGGTLNAIANLLSYAGVFLAAMWLTRNPGRAQAARLWLAAAGSAYAVYGIVNFLTGPSWPPGVYIDATPKSLMSTFVNRNNFATFAGLCLLCAFSILIDRVSHILSTSRPARQKAAMVIEALLMQSAFLTAGTLAIALALFMTASRGGIAASLLALALLTYLRTRGSGRSAGARIVMPALLAVAIGIGFIAGGDRLLTRIERGGVWITQDTGRIEMFQTTAGAIASAPLTGTGFGTYELAIELYRGQDARVFSIWEKAHNSYLESTMELGIPAALSLHLSLLVLAVICLRGVRARRRGRSFPALGVAATLLVGLHALVDFSLQIPAVALTYAFIMGLAIAQSGQGDARRAAADAPASAKTPGERLA